jgi:histidine triad (HIT) family protein
MRDPDCVFCKIASAEIKADIVRADADVVAFNDLNPRAPLHVLVIPREHIPSLAEAEDARLVGVIAQTAAAVARDAGYGRSGFRVVTNVGPDAGQSVNHLHFHVLAGRRLAWPPG